MAIPDGKQERTNDWTTGLTFLLALSPSDLQITGRVTSLQLVFIYPRPLVRPGRRKGFAAYLALSEKLTGSHRF